MALPNIQTAFCVIQFHSQTQQGIAMLTLLVQILWRSDINIKHNPQKRTVGTRHQPTGIRLICSHPNKLHSPWSIWPPLNRSTRCRVPASFVAVCTWLWLTGVRLLGLLWSWFGVSGCVVVQGGTYFDLLFKVKDSRFKIKDDIFSPVNKLSFSRFSPILTLWPDCHAGHWCWHVCTVLIRQK